MGAYIFLPRSSHENLRNSRDLTCRIITMSRRLFQRDRQTMPRCHEEVKKNQTFSFALAWNSSHKFFCVALCSSWYQGTARALCPISILSKKTFQSTLLDSNHISKSSQGDKSKMQSRKKIHFKNFNSFENRPRACKNRSVDFN